MAGFDIDTSSIEKKLRAIAKHATALADELKEIDAATCPQCGSSKVEVKKSLEITRLAIRSSNVKRAG